MKLIGITGSIASGKSEMSKYILSKGYFVVDADYIARNITKKGKKAYYKILEEFPTVIDDTNCEIDRKKLSNIVFSNKSKLNRLNFIVHPIIFEEIDYNLSILGNEDIVFLDAPLLFETGLDRKCDEIILVYCNEKIQLQRIISRDKIDELKAKKIIQSQMSLKEKIKRSNYVLSNNESLEKLYLKIDIVLDIIKFNL